MDIACVTKRHQQRSGTFFFLLRRQPTCQTWSTFGQTMDAHLLLGLVGTVGDFLREPLTEMIAFFSGKDVN